jgi:hypothetical protein
MVLVVDLATDEVKFDNNVGAWGDLAKRDPKSEIRVVLAVAGRPDVVSE